MPITFSRTQFYGSWLLALLIGAGYGYLLFWFDHVDFYSRHFFDHGPLVVHYQTARLLFIAFMAWLIYALGAGMLSLVDRQSFIGLVTWERYPLAFITGAALWHIALFGIGLAGYDTKPMAITITLTVMLLSLPHLAYCLRETATIIRLIFTSAASAWLPQSLLALFFLGAAALFLFTKGLYPAGGHDYYTHYFYFNKAVIRTGSILPNEAWYHFFYSKGLGLHFLAMLLTDPLGPQLVTASFIFAGAFMVFALLRRTTSNSMLPWVGAILYITCLIYTPGPKMNMLQGGWADLEKQHELTAVFILSIIWCLSRLLTSFTPPPRLWLVALHTAIVATALITTPLTILIGIYMALLMAWFAYKKQRHNVRLIFAAAVTAGIALVAVLCINYICSGEFTDIGVPYIWRWMNLPRIEQWGTLFEVMLVDQMRTNFLLHPLPWAWNIIPIIFNYLRLELWSPFMVAALLVIGYRWHRLGARGLNISSDTDIPFAVLLLFLLAAIIVALFGGGRTESVSFYRMSSFCYAPTLCTALLLWRMIPETAWPSSLNRRLIALILVPVVLIGLRDLVQESHLRDSKRGKWERFHESNIRDILDNADKLEQGQFSLKDAYQNQQGWPGRMQWGGIYPALENVWKIAGPNTRIWSFHNQSYCMLPDCNLQGFISFRFSPQWPTVFFGTPEEARKVLQSEGLNYFFFSKELDFVDMLPATPLFSPENINRYLAVRWTDGTSYLLTWPGPDTTALPADFILSYRDNAQKSAAYQTFRNSRKDWKAIADYVTLHKDNLTPFFLPWCLACDGMPGLTYGN